jgi:hypothetical protein
MDISFKEVERTFAARFGISEGRVAAFRGRLQHLQRQKFFPDRVNTGKGRKAIYGWRQVIQLMVALDLIDQGLTPDAAVERVRGQGATDRLVRASYEVVHGFKEVTELHSSIAAGYCPFDRTRYVLCSAAALSFAGEASASYLILLDGEDFVARLHDDPGLTPTAAMIDFGSRLMLVCSILSQETELDVPAVAADLLEWTHGEIHGEPQS